MEVTVSAREAEVLSLLAERRTNAEIAERLFISVRTVESHVSSLLRKYGVADRRALSAVLPAAATRPCPAGAAPTGPPAPRTAFFGREAELETLARAVDDARLVSLVGVGGVGKTRLAVEFAARWPPSAFVDLVPVRDGSVAQAVAATLGVTPGPRQPLSEAISDGLGADRSLLVLDNCEHLLDAVAAFADRLLTACPGVTLLTTGRERLGVPGELVLPVLPLPGSDGRALFLDRARSAGARLTDDTATVDELCARLDNVPLAIELAAARSASLGAAGLLAALTDPLRVLTGGRRADRRHRSLRGVLDWSYGLLDADEQTLFRRLSVFVGGFDLAGAARVAPHGDVAETADLLGRLVEKSLVTRERGADRWRMLGTVRAFAGEHLGTDPARGQVFDRYLEWATSTASDLVDRLGGEWRDDFDLAADDLRAALLAHRYGARPAPHRLARALGRLSYARGFVAAALDCYRQAAARAPDPAEAVADLRAAADCALVGTATGRQVLDLLLTCAELAEAAGDGNAQALALTRVVELVDRFDGRLASDLTRERLTGLLERARATGDPADPAVAAAVAIAAAWHAGGRPNRPDQELAAVAAAAARRCGVPTLVSAGLDVLGTAHAQAGRAAAAQRIARERFELLGTLDSTDPRAAPEIGDIVHGMATVAIRAGDLPAALGVARRMATDQLAGDRTHSLTTLVPALALRGRLHESLAQAEALWQGWQRADRPPSGQLVGAMAFAVLACGFRGDRGSLPLWRERLTTSAAGAGVSLANLPSAVFADCRLALHLGDFADASRLVERAFAAFSGFRYEAYARAAGAELAVAAGLPDAVRRLAAAEADVADNAWAAAGLARARWRSAADPEALVAALTGWQRIGACAEYACTLALLPGREEEARAELRSLGMAAPDG
ncbi:ATP-binding protein [Micromonospora mirobrigensis]|uniref:Predicted ATPase n=1 Tax=Micromonospora mirobrigensis TaxID=262898 RepID=A0A1C4ZS58_9ACTN|nr:LuxR C-terminal-related transcriptional regulator [Micromonospora mirobrigensis]SCF35666.1 Predicted ATPase [Micromonospora mirobrigensis]